MTSFVHTKSQSWRENFGRGQATWLAPFGVWITWRPTFKSETFMGKLSDSDEVLVQSEVFMVQLDIPIYESLILSVNDVGTVFDSSLTFFH